MTSSVLVAVIGVVVLIGLAVFVGVEMETEGQLRGRQATTAERLRLQEERSRLEDVRRRLQNERRKLERDRERYGAPRCPNCPFRYPPSS